MSQAALCVNSEPSCISIWCVEGHLSLGTCTASLFYSRKGWWYLNRIKVEPGHQGKGLGARMLAELFEALKKKPHFVGLMVEPGGYGSDPMRLQKFYRQNGFKKVGQHMEWTPSNG